MPAGQDVSGNLVGTLREILAEALAAYDRGELRRTEEILRQITDSRPNLATAWHIRGLTAQRRGDLMRAGEYLATAAAREPENPDYCRDFGTALAARGQHREALDILRRASTLAPEDASTQFHIANALMHLGQPAEAVRHYRTAAEGRADSPELLGNLAAALREIGETDDAIIAAERALAIEPDYPEALNNLGLALCDARRYPEAIERFERAIMLDPGDEEILNNLAVALHAAGRYAEAEDRLRTALDIRPRWGEAALNLGNLVRAQERFEEAVDCYRTALATDPMDFQAYGNLGLVLINLNRPDEAIAVYEKALALRPDQADIRMSLGIAQLMKGDYDEGWRNYEWRWSADSFTSRKRSFDCPAWDGSPLQGRRVLVHAEQGFGDTLQFCRYAPLLAEGGAEVVFECQQPLARLCSSLEGVSRLLPRGEPLPASDYHVPLLSLPRLFRTTLATVPDNVPYLKAPDDIAAAWRDRVPRDGRPAVGLVWTGNPDRQDDTMRSCPKAALAPLLALEGLRFVSLQVGDAPDETMPDVIDLGTGFGDFADTAGAMEAMDLVVTVDTGAAHLAGALGRPVWVLLGHHADWHRRRIVSPPSAPPSPTSDTPAKRSSPSAGPSNCSPPTISPAPACIRCCALPASGRKNWIGSRPRSTH